MRDDKHLLNSPLMLPQENRKSRDTHNWLEWKLGWAKIVDVVAHITGLVQRIFVEWNNNKYSTACNGNAIGQGHLTKLSGHSICTSELDIFHSKASTSHCTLSGNIFWKDRNSFSLRWPSGSHRFESEDYRRGVLVLRGLDQVLQVRYPFWRLHR